MRLHNKAMDLKLKPSTPTFCFLFTLLLVYPKIVSCSQQACNHQDQSALLTFSANISTFSSPPLNWSSTISCCHWEGVYCDANGRVIHLQLPSRGLKGMIAPSLGNLVALTQLNLSTNLLFGSLPDGFFRLMYSLQNVDLSFNRLSGNFSSSLSFKDRFPSQVLTIDISNNQFQGMIESAWFLGATNMTSFNCKNNSFVGHIPSSLCLSAPLLETLDLSHNHFSGLLPTAIGGCSQLKIFRAGFNSLFGSISEIVYSLRELREISMPHNDLDGPLGEGIVGLSKLRVIDLSSNSIFGLIPHEIGDLLYLEKLYLDSNNLSGPIPPSLMNCTNLVEIVLRGNHLDGDISKLDMSKLVHLQKLDLMNNSFNGSLPESLYSCKSLVAIRVAVNNLTGQISPKIIELKSLSYLSIGKNSFRNITGTLTILAKCKNLTFLFLGMNYFGESLPSNRAFLGSMGFPKLEFFSLDGCNLAGSFPEWLHNLNTLRALGLNKNRITGKIPDWIGTLPNLFFLSLSSNSLFGEIPQELCHLPALKSKVDPKLNHFHIELPFFSTSHTGYNQYATFPPSLIFTNNKLSGPIPSDIGKLQGLQRLHLANNNLSGHIPASLSYLKNLEVLELDKNNLTGGIPVSLTNLHFLSHIDVSYNDLEGPIPTGGQFDTFTKKNFEGNPHLCGEILGLPCSNAARPEDKDQPAEGGSDSKQSFLNGLIVGCASGFSGVLVIVASFVWFKI